MGHTTKVITTVEHTINLSKAELLSLLVRKEGVPRNVTNVNCTVEVPRGGDYSGTTLSLDEVGGITITWQERTEE